MPEVRLLPSAPPVAGWTGHAVIPSAYRRDYDDGHIPLLDFLITLAWLIGVVASLMSVGVPWGAAIVFGYLIVTHVILRD